MASKIALGTKDVAATEHPLASLAAVRAFGEGGNAFDAAASASAVLSVVQPQLSGLGGDFFGLLYEGATGRVHCLNSSGWSPTGFTVEMMGRRGGVPRFGHASVVVPGYVKGVWEMQRRFGRLEFSRCLGRAVELAEHGFAVGPGLASGLARLGDDLSTGARKVFMPSGGAPRVGTVIKQERLGKTLRDIVEGGPDGFYRGEAGRAVREEMAGAGVALEEKDLSDYSPEWCEPLRMEYRGTEVFEVPPNSMGATSLLMLRILEESGRSFRANSAERIKAMVEAAQAAYATRDKMLGDPRFSRFDLEEFLGSGVRSSPQKRIDKADTTYFAVADREGNVLSCIQSIFYNFGSKVFVEKGGFFLNNRGSAFRLEGPNKVEPRKRPLHTLSALLLSRGGRPFVATGASGGEYRPQQHTLLATNIIDYEMELDEAVDFPRFLWDGAGEVLVEEGYGSLPRMELHCELVRYPGPTGVAQGVQVLDGSLKGVCDVRGEGLPAGE